MDSATSVSLYTTAGATVGYFLLRLRGIRKTVDGKPSQEDIDLAVNAAVEPLTGALTKQGNRMRRIEKRLADCEERHHPHAPAKAK